MVKSSKKLKSSKKINLLFSTYAISDLGLQKNKKTKKTKNGQNLYRSK